MAMLDTLACKERLLFTATASNELLLGYSRPSSARGSIGFTYNPIHDSLHNSLTNNPLTHNPPNSTNQHITGNNAVTAASGHLMTIAPTGTGKGVGSVIPTLLSYTGSMVVIDPKGENFAITQGYRRAIGQKVLVLDPFGITDEESDALNPLDLIDLEGPSALDDIKALVEHLVNGVTTPNDVFWDQSAKQLITWLLVVVLYKEPPVSRSLTTLMELLALPHEKLKAVLDSIPKFAWAMVSVAPFHFDYPERTAECIIGTARLLLDYLLSRQVARSINVSSVGYNELSDPDCEFTLYLVVPPDKLESHRGLLRAWLGAIFLQLLRRPYKPQLDTLFMLDEAAQLGHMVQIRQAITLLRGYGVRIWSFWQDASQLISLYPNDWQTLVNNCAGLQMFGFPNLLSCKKAAELIGWPDYVALMDLTPHQQLLQLAGQQPMIIDRVNYLSDAMYLGRFAENPFYRQANSESFNKTLNTAYKTSATTTLVELGDDSALCR